MNKLFKEIFLIAILLVLLLANQAFSCPLVKRGLIDFNCDGIFKISVLGDSIARGRGDQQNGDLGGYAKRLEKIADQVSNLGVNGLTTRGLILSLNRNNKKLVKALKNSDLVIIDIGRNDFFDYLSEQVSLKQIVRNLFRIRKMTKSLIASKDIKLNPFVLNGTLIRVNRTDQNVYIGELNELIKVEHSRKKINAYLKFDQIFSKTNLNSDNLHPTSAGYDQIYKYLRKYINKDLQNFMSALRPDANFNGIYDLFE